MVVGRFVVVAVPVPVVVEGIPATLEGGVAVEVACLMAIVLLAVVKVLVVAGVALVFAVAVVVVEVVVVVIGAAVPVCTVIRVSAHGCGIYN